MAYQYPQNTFQPVPYPYYSQNQQQSFFPPQVIQPQQTQLVAQNQPQTTTNPVGTNIIWTKDELSVAEYPVAIGNTVILVDYDFKTVYKKATDLTGKPLPIEVYDLIPRGGTNATSTDTPQVNVDNLITKEEFAEFKTKLKQKLEELSNDDNEMVVVKKRGRKQRVEAEIVDSNGEVIKDASSDEL